MSVTERKPVAGENPKAEAPIMESDNYVFKEPEGEISPSSHFSNLLFSGDLPSTVMEATLLVGLTAAATMLPKEVVDVKGSMPLTEVAAFFWCTSIVTRVYNSYLEACWFAFPQYRTQPPGAHALVKGKDLCGRMRSQLEQLVLHDRLTLLSQFVFGVFLYYALPGYYPAAEDATDWLPVRVLKLALNHYIMSFGMYWGHRAYHVNPWLWKHLHSVHHWARHPLSRNTYQDHWLENLVNHVAGHFAAQVLCPLDHGCFWVSHVFRILESLEKHSGISCYLNLAHQTQRWLPFAQMPHHHDWHHEGHKSCNFTFSSIGGVWDCVFGTRKIGRSEGAPDQMTAFDKAQAASKDEGGRKLIMDDQNLCLVPSTVFMCIVMWKLMN
jgi:sterol desaturase/sphingolipid hydroxylase (fatty acid hydroxylase superfamily)